MGRRRPFQVTTPHQPANIHPIPSLFWCNAFLVSLPLQVPAEHWSPPGRGGRASPVPLDNLLGPRAGSGSQQE